MKKFIWIIVFCLFSTWVQAKENTPPSSPLAERWAEQNPWFGSIEEMTDYSFEVHRKLIGENYNPNSIKYYVEVDKRMRAKFPNNFENDSTPFIEAGVKTSFKQMVEKIGSKKYNYAKANKYWKEKNFEKLFLEDQLGAYEGIPQSTGNYAYAYCKGQGVKENLEECLFWNKLGVYLDDVFSMETLAWIYKYNNTGNLFLPIEDKNERIIEAQQLCEKAVLKRSIYCMVILGDYKYNNSDIYKIQNYTKRLGRESPIYRDLAEAYFWYTLAIQNAKSERDEKNIADWQIKQDLNNIKRNFKSAVRNARKQNVEIDSLLIDFKIDFSDYRATEDTAADIFFKKIIYMVKKWRPGDTYEDISNEYNKLTLYRPKGTATALKFPDTSSQVKESLSTDEILVFVETEITKQKLIHCKSPDGMVFERNTSDCGIWEKISRDEYYSNVGEIDYSSESVGDWIKVEYLSGCPIGTSLENCRLEKGWIQLSEIKPLKKNDPIAKILRQPTLCLDKLNKYYYYKEKDCPTSSGYSDISLGDFIAKDYVRFSTKVTEIPDTTKKIVHKLIHCKSPDGMVFERNTSDCGIWEKISKQEFAEIKVKITKIEEQKLVLKETKIRSSSLRFIKLHNKAFSKNKTIFTFDDGETYLVGNKKIALSDVVEPFVEKQVKFNSDETVGLVDQYIALDNLVEAEDVSKLESIKKEISKLESLKEENEIITKFVIGKPAELELPDPSKYIPILEDYLVAINTSIRNKPSISKLVEKLEQNTIVHVLGKPEKDSKWYHIEYVNSKNEEIIGYVLQDKLVTMRGQLDPGGQGGIGGGGDTEGDFGNYYALIIAIDKYEDINFADLKTPVNDARTIESVLFDKYNFLTPVTLYNKDATRKRVYQELDRLLADMKENDNLLIFYSGHGYEHKKLNTGYWQLYDAKPNEKDTWLNLDGDLLPYLNAMDAGHILVVVDSCFAGKIFTQKGSEDEDTTADDRDKKDILKDYKKTTSRLGLTASALKPIPDDGGGGHSVFAKALIEILEDNEEDYISSEDINHYLKQKIKKIREDKKLPDIYRNIKPLHNNLDIQKHEVGGMFYFDLQDQS